MKIMLKLLLVFANRCGLVALCMASSCTSNPLTEEQLLQEARSRGFTNHGEMFSVDDMAALARDMLEKSCRKVEVLSGGLGQDKEYVIQQLKSDGILLIPYPLLATRRLTLIN